MKISLFVIAFLISPSLRAQKIFTVSSPSGQLSIAVRTGDTLAYAVSLNKQSIVAYSPIALLVSQGKNPGIKSSLLKTSIRTVKETITNPVPFKRRIVPDHYNELVLQFKENFSVIFRAYDDGIAYRFQTSIRDSIQIVNEIAEFRFPSKARTYFAEVQKREDLDMYHTSFEEPYKVTAVDSISTSRIAFSPVLVDVGTAKLVITESDLNQYPGMFLGGTGKNSLRGDFAPYPDKEAVQGGEFKQVVALSRKNYISTSYGVRTYPWRVIAVAKEDRELIMNDLVYRLGAPPTSSDWSWVQPGISTDEWIIGINLRNVNFKAGINTATYKYYIDFAKRFGMQYVLMDAGWSDNNDLFSITPEIDLEEIAAYAKYKNIRLMLWTLSMTLDKQLEPFLDRCNKLGVQAIMTDFMDRDDQKAVAFYHRVAAATARHKIMVMFHGAFKNAGLERTFPNAVTREGVLGSEYNIWSDKASPDHDLMLPFIRMVSGPMDYEPGFMDNANQRTFRPLPDHVMSQGTRVHQLAMYVVYESAFQVFSGNPSDAWQEIEYTTYLASLPTSWDDTFVIDGKVGDYVVVARRKDNDWYIGAMTDWTARDMEIDLGFLGEGDFNAFTCSDGLNAEKNGKDYAMGFQRVNKTSKLKIHLASGGGYVAKLIRR